MTSLRFQTLQLQSMLTKGRGQGGKALVRVGGTTRALSRDPRHVPCSATTMKAKHACIKHRPFVYPMFCHLYGEGRVRFVSPGSKWYGIKMMWFWGLESVLAARSLVQVVFIVLQSCPMQGSGGSLFSSMSHLLGRLSCSINEVITMVTQRQ